MNNHELLEDLDARAASAATDLHGQASERPRPAFDAERPLSVPISGSAVADSRRPKRALLAVAAVLLVVVGAVAVVANQSGNDRTEDVASNSGQPRPFQATWLPEGLRLHGAYEAGAGSPGRGNSPMAVELYGPSPSDPQVGITVASSDGFSPDGPSVEKVDLGDGRQADWFQVAGLIRRTLVVTSGQHQIVFLASEDGQAEVVSIARGTRLKGTDLVVETDALPDGWEHLGTEPDLMGALNSVRMSAYGSGYGSEADEATEGNEGNEVNQPTESNETTQSVTVASMPGTEARLAASRLLLQGVHEVTVRGHQALVGSMEAGSPTVTMRTVSWLDQPGELVRVSTLGLTEAEMIRVAENLKVIDEDEWAAILRQSQLEEFQNDPKLEIGRGEFPDGTAWVVRKDGDSDGSTQLSVAIGPLDSSSSSSSGFGSAGGSEPGFRSVETLDKGGRYFASGLLGDAVASVELRSATGTVLGQATIVEGNGERAWVAELTEDPTVVVAVDANGVELDQRTLDELAGNVTAGDGVDSPSSFEGQGQPIAPAGTPATTVPG